MPTTKFIARQPIFDRWKTVYGYELLFRSGLNNYFDALDGDLASLNVIADSLLVHGLETLAQHRRAFINFSHTLLVQNHACLLSKNNVVIEVLESVLPDPDAMAACKRLKDLGYRLALDDVQSCDRIAEFLGVIDIVKVDLPATSTEDRKEMVLRFASHRIEFLAEKVETNEEFNELKEMGYQYFQGYFFSKPEMIQTKEVPASTLNYLSILQSIHQPEINFKEAEDIIKREPSLCYKLLRYLNSPLFGFRSGIQSIRHAITILGQSEFRMWASLVVMVGMCRDKPHELIVTSLIRASFCESVGRRAGVQDQNGNCFLLGLFSMVDGILDQPLSEVLSSLPLDDSIKVGLQDPASRFGAILRMVKAYEIGDWETLSSAANSLGIDEEETSKMYMNAVEWTNHVDQAG